MADRIEQRLGNYRLIHFLGQGGFADVYLGEHIYLKTQAALKVLRIHLADDALQDFLNEAQTIAHLEHPHIVRVLECGVENHTPFLVMNYAPNGTLRQLHPRGSRLPLQIVLPYVQQIASALEYAHDKKLIHRDIKPENMLLKQNNEILLSDFGLALLAQSTSSQTTKEMAGTIPYMAPEQLRGKPRLASDQYALGIVVYEWLSGERPFQGSFVEVASQHLLAPPPPLYGRVPGVTPDVEQVVFTALAKDPQQRFATVQMFANALGQAYNKSQQSIFSALLPPMPPSVVSQFTSAPVDITPSGTITTFPHDRIAPTRNVPHSQESQFVGIITQKLPSAPMRSPIPSTTPITPFWTLPFIPVFGAFLILMLGSSLYVLTALYPTGYGFAFLFEAVLSLLLLLIASTAKVHGPIPRTILSITGIAALFSGFVFAGTGLQGLPVTITILLSSLSPNIGLIIVSIISLLWSVRPFGMLDRIILAVPFGIAFICTLIQLPLPLIPSATDSASGSHILLLIALIALIQGTLLAVQMERVREKANV